MLHPVEIIRICRLWTLVTRKIFSTCGLILQTQPPLLDASGRLAVHILTEQARGYYRLEELWKAEPRDLTFYDNAEQYLTLDNIRVPEEAPKP